MNKEELKTIKQAIMKVMNFIKWCQKIQIQKRLKKHS